VAVKHAFTDPKADGGDATVVRPSDWNADHVFTGVPRLVAADLLVAAGASLVVSYDYEVAAGFVLEIAAAATLEVL